MSEDKSPAAGALSGTVRFAGILGASFVILFLTFRAVFTVPYAHHDQYRYFIDDGCSADVRRSCRSDPQYGWLFRIGRPLAAKMECAVFRRTRALKDLVKLRYGVLLVISLGCALFAAHLSSAGMGLSTPVGFFLALAVYTLPGVQNALFMTNFPNAFTPLFSLSAYLLLEKSLALLGERLRWTALCGLAAAGGLLMLAFFTYSAMGFFFFLPLFASVLLREEEARVRRRRVFRSGFFFAGAAAVYYAVVRTVFYPADVEWQRTIPSGYRFALTLDHIPDKVVHLLRRVLPGAANLWNIYPRASIAWSVAAFIAGGMALHVAEAGSAAERKSRVEKCLLAAAVFLGANALYILTNTFFLYRLIFVQGALLTVALFWSLGVLLRRAEKAAATPGRGAPAVAALLAGAGVCLAAVTTRRNAVNSFMEFQYIKACIVGRFDRPFNKVHIVQAALDKAGNVGFNGFPIVTDEFNAPSTGFSTDFVYMVKLAMVELGRDGAVAQGPARAEPEGPARAVRLSRERGAGWILTNESGGQSRALLAAGGIEALDWKIRGEVSGDGRTIRWSNGSRWVRKAGGGGLAGEWILRPDADKTWVTLSPPGEPFPRSPDMVVIDMDGLRLRGENVPSSVGKMAKIK